MIDPDRAERAYTDVLAVEFDQETEMMRVVTLSDCYDVDVRDFRHMCPDREYHDVALCKHLICADIVRGQTDAPSGWFVTDDFDQRTDDDQEQEQEQDDGFPDFEDFELEANA